MFLEAILPKLSLDTDINSISGQQTETALTPVASPVPSTPTPPTPPFLPLASPPALGRRRLDAFHIICLIGKGGFGKVFMVRHKATGDIYAMKVMEKETLVKRKAVRDAHSERNILALVGQIDAKFIIRLHVAFQTSKRVYLVMDFAAGGELMFHLRRECMFSEESAKFYAAELLIALETLHNMDIVHRDIKPENVLLDDAGHLILTDFGLAKELAGLTEQTHSWCGSEDYMAPEIVARATHDGKPADYWAYGVFIYDCVCGQPPFSPLHEKGKITRKKLHDRILKCKFKLPKFLTNECHGLLRKLLTKEPQKRLTDPDKIRSHSWFRNINWDAIREKTGKPPINLPKGSPTACFSPTLTKNEYSAPQSPISLGPSAAPMAIPGATNGLDADVMWQGFSFVAPGMEVHFELAPPALEMSERLLGNRNLGQSIIIENSLAAQSPPAEMNFNMGDEGVEWEDALVAELAEFSVDAAEAVEIAGGNV